MANDKNDGTDNKPDKHKQTAGKKAATTKQTVTKSAEENTAADKAASKKTAEAASAVAAESDKKSSSPATPESTSPQAATETSTKATSGAAIKRTKPKKDKRTGIEGRRSEDKVMPGLLKNLQGVFDKINSDNKLRDRSHDQLTEEFTTHMQRAFLEMHKQIEEREQLLEKRLENIDRTHKNQLMGVKILSIPITLLSIIAIVYLFYVVRVMETSMTSMSKDMHIMNGYIETMTANTTALSVNTDKIYGTTYDMTQSVSSMDAQMTTLNKDVDNMMIDLHYMSRSVTPAMQGINRFMP
jgi:hypothetical protein